jgi:uncharacterized protein YjbI with pentapeptide repeats
MPDLTRKELIQLLAPHCSFFSTSNIKPVKLKVRLAGVNLAGVDLSNLDLSCVDFSYANLDGCNMRGCQMSWAQFWHARMRGCDLSEAESTEVNGSDFSYADLTNSRLTGAHILGARCECTVFDGVDFTGAKLRSGDFGWASFRRTKLINIDISNSGFYRNAWAGAIVRGGDWSEVYCCTGKPRGIRLPFKAKGHDPKFVPDAA